MSIPTRTRTVHVQVFLDSFLTQQNLVSFFETWPIQGDKVSSTQSLQVKRIAGTTSSVAVGNLRLRDGVTEGQTAEIRLTMLASPLDPNGVPTSSSFMIPMVYSNDSGWVASGAFYAVDAASLAADGIAPCITSVSGPTAGYLIMTAALSGVCVPPTA